MTLWRNTCPIRIPEIEDWSFFQGSKAWQQTCATLTLGCEYAKEANSDPTKISSIVHSSISRGRAAEFATICPNTLWKDLVVRKCPTLRRISQCCIALWCKYLKTQSWLILISWCFVQEWKMVWWGGAHWFSTTVSACTMGGGWGVCDRACLLNTDVYTRMPGHGGFTSLFKSGRIWLRPELQNLSVEKRVKGKHRWEVRFGIQQTYPKTKDIHVLNTIESLGKMG